MIQRIERRVLLGPYLDLDVLPPIGILVRGNPQRNRKHTGNQCSYGIPKKINKCTSYARICVYIPIVKPLPDVICLTHEDSDWIQPLDYEHVPFRCCKFHEHGHLYKDFPLNKAYMEIHKGDR